MGKKRKTTEALVEELRLFNHDEAATRLEWLQREYDELRWRMDELEK